MALLAVVVGGLLSDTRLSVHGWPGEPRGGSADLASSGPAMEARPSRLDRPSPSVTRSAVRPAVSIARPASPAASPSPEPSLSPEPSPSPVPGRAAEPAPASPSPSAPELTTAPTAESTPDVTPDPGGGGLIDLNLTIR
ncbi:hypothetical protein [Herbidospora daliensis]|uniref:hypothetical protein n=1 Tax=Herbidospora daliensis TaxID=295585 RepID=UPI0012FBF6CD|nr:hypothetical protein [Herbidospora daliensis]